ncbi:trefoil factor 2-like [Actinia tenebrosa]|uniref:Trefoil factor 2-like n=1 Tax=Actinia tenebrosa TaxID=6105 RepID=A0A6P8IY78_ACTTE|nr:trefoil factor 2-like [Actinia tenebrosa]
MLLNRAMERVILIVLLAGVCVFARPSQEDSGECDVASSHRLECGWLGIDEQTCLNRGCCWDSSDRNAKFCFVKKGQHLLEGQCPVAPSERQECGYSGITRDECLKKYCCWDDSVPNAKWCFKEPNLPPAGCYIYHGVSGVCRYTCHAEESKAYGMSFCSGRICCYKKTYGK